MTYDEIINALVKRECHDTVRGLEYAVEQEKTSLHENTTKYKRRDNGRAAREAAREFYAEDITNQLNDPRPPIPLLVINRRRFAIAWAVAEVLRTNDDVTEGGKKKV